MGYRLLADLTLILHLSFILFALFGGLLCIHRAYWALCHLPALAWGVWVEWSGSICPLTPWENNFRALAYEQGYQGGFIDHYLLPFIYPQQLTIPLQWMLGGALLAINSMIYLYVFAKRRKRRRQVDE